MTATEAAGSTPRRARWSLGRRLLSIVAALGVLLLVVVAASTALLVDVRQRQDVVTVRYFTALQLSEQQYVWLVDAETAVRGYALTHDEALLQPLDDGAANAATTRRIRTALRSDPGSLAALDRVQGSASTWYRDWVAPSIDLVRAGGQLTPDRVEDGKELFDQVRADFASYLAVVGRERAAAHQALAFATDLLFAAVVVSAAAGLACVAVLWALLRRWVSRPVAHLAAQARQVRAGALGAPVTGTGPRELLDLAADVESMRSRLVTQLEEAEEAAAALRTAQARLEASSADLQRSNRDLEQFAYVASHDLQEPLRKVASFCQLLQKRYAGQLDDRADQYIGFAVDGAKRMQQLVNDLLAFSRVGRAPSGADDDARPVDLAVCWHRALATLSSVVGASGATVTAGPLPSVPGQEVLLTQLLVNLVANAVKFRDPDRPPVVRLSASMGHAGPDGAAEWEFCCADNGIGIEPAYADRVFVIFQRLHAKEAYAGTGIGLALCQRIVEHHGGRIWVDTTHTGIGTRVCWRLPAQISGNPPVLPGHPVEQEPARA